MNQTVRTWLVANAASGSNSDEDVRAVITALEAAGRAPTRVVDIASELPPRRDQLADVDLLVLFAGDGTVNGIVNTLDGWPGRVLVLPGGTSNLLSRALHGERDAPAIIASLDAMRPVRRSIIRTSQGAALIELLAGPGAMWSDVREGLRDGELADIADSAVTAARESVNGPMVSIVEPRIGRDEGYAGVRLTPEAGGIAVSGYGAQGIADYVRQGLALLMRDFRDGPHDKLGLHQRIACRSAEDAPMALMIDGERATGTALETFSLAPLGVDLLSSTDG